MNNIFEGSVSVGSHQVLLRGQDSQHEVLGRVLVLGNFSQVIDLLFTDGDGIVYGLAVQVNMSLGILGIIDLIKHLPGDIPMNLLLSILVLLFCHRIAGIKRILILPLEIIVHLPPDVLILLLNGVVSFLNHLILLLLRILVLLRSKFEIWRNVFVQTYDLRRPEAWLTR